ncbi:hypothetical protein DFH11DRAFT_773531 [Phellopilus nigrolimitatus]|nr:hypothetical protein DFH11DRAFT_773531 [Phellopilus nigrolimitatus]
MATPPVSTLHLDLSGTFGVVFWAFVVSTVLFGVSIVQGYFYFMHNNDKWTLRLFVSCMLTLDFATTALSSQSLHDYLIVNFGNPDALLYMTAPYIIEYFVTGVVTLGSQLFYASRIHIAVKTSRRWGIPVIIVLLALSAFAMAIAATNELFVLGRLISGLEGKAMMTIAGLNTSLAAACDILATLSMCIFLASQKSTYKQTRTIIMFLLFITINRGVLVAIAQIGFLASYLSAPTKIYWMPFHLSVSKLHVNTLLAMLNSRTNLRTRTEVTQVRFSKDCTFNTTVGQHFPRSPTSAKGSLRLSGMAYELGELPKAMNSSSPTTLASPSTKYTGDDRSVMTYGDEHEMPPFNHDGGSGSSIV